MRQISTSIAALVLGLGGVASTARAADFATQPIPGSDVTAVYVSGQIESGDGQRFAASVEGIGKALVILEGPGGSTIDALEMGNLIRARHFTTDVTDGRFCLSACAITWLGGATVAMASTARIGFHATFEEVGDQKVVNGAGNAVVGSYMAKLGVPDSMIIFASQAGPDDVQYLTPAIATRLGFPVRVVEGDRVTLTTATRDARGITPEDGAVRQTMPSSVDERATAPQPQPRMAAVETRLATIAGRTTSEWIAAASTPAKAAEGAFDRIYGDEATVDGRRLDHDAAVRAEVDRVSKTANRRYALRSNKLIADCRASSFICTTSGIMDWHGTDRAGRARSGSYTFEFAMSVEGDSARLLGRTMQPVPKARTAATHGAPASLQSSAR